jgi:hypothetical protein
MCLDDSSYPRSMTISCDPTPAPFPRSESAQLRNDRCGSGPTRRRGRARRPWQRNIGGLGQVSSEWPVVGAAELDRHRATACPCLQRRETQRWWAARSSGSGHASGAVGRHGRPNRRPVNPSIRFPPNLCRTPARGRIARSHWPTMLRNQCSANIVETLQGVRDGLRSRRQSVRTAGVDLTANLQQLISLAAAMHVYAR